MPSTPVLLSIGFIIIYFGTCKIFARREGYYSTVALFGLACYVYYVGVPLEFALFDIDSFDMGHLDLILNKSDLSFIVILATLAFLSFAAGYYLSGFRPFDEPSCYDARVSEKVPFSIKLLLPVCLAVVLVVYRDQLATIGTYEGSYSTTYESPEFQLLCSLAYFCVAIIAAVFMGTKRPWHRAAGFLLVGSIFAWGLYSSDKNPMVVGALALGTLFLGQRSQRMSFLLLLIFGSGLIVFLFAVFSVIYRAEGDQSVATVFLEYFGLRHSDPVGPLASLQSALESHSFMYGFSYLMAPLLLIPKFLWPGRPPDLSEAYALEHIKHWSEGEGMGFSLLAEAYLNFAWIGAVIQYFFLGLLWGIYWKNLRLILWHFGTRTWSALYCILGYYLLVIMHRGPFSGFLKSLLHYGIALVVFAVLFDLSMIRRQLAPTSVNESET